MSMPQSDDVLPPPREVRVYAQLVVDAQSENDPCRWPTVVKIAAAYLRDVPAPAPAPLPIVTPSGVPTATVSEATLPVTLGIDTDRPSPAQGEIHAPRHRLDTSVTAPMRRRPSTPPATSVQHAAPYTSLRGASPLHGQSPFVAFVGGEGEISDGGIAAPLDEDSSTTPVPVDPPPGSSKLRRTVCLPLVAPDTAPRRR